MITISIVFYLKQKSPEYFNQSNWAFLRQSDKCHIKGRSRTAAPAVCPPAWNFFGLVFVNFDGITHIYFHWSHTQCLQYLFYHLLSLQKHTICVKGHQTILRPQKFYRAGTMPPRFWNSWICHCKWLKNHWKTWKHRSTCINENFVKLFSWILCNFCT